MGRGRLAKADIHELADRFEPRLRKAFLEAIEALKRAMPVNEIADLIETGQLTQALAALPDLPDLRELRAALADLAVRSADTVAVELGFALKNERAIRWATEHAARLVTGVNDETRSAIRDIIVRSQREGLNVRSQAQLIRDIVGLTQRDARAVERMVAGMTEDGLADDFIARRRESMANRLLRRRAENIARTESIRSSNMGTQIGWRQAQDEGLLPQSARKVWIITPDQRLCELCAPLEGAVVGVAEAFTTDVKATGFKVTSQTGEDRVEITSTEPIVQFTDLTPPRHPSCRCSLGLVT